MKRFTNALSQASEPPESNPPKDVMDTFLQEDETEQDVEANKWDDKALQEMSTYIFAADACAMHVAACQSSGGTSTGRHLVGRGGPTLLGGAAAAPRAMAKAGMAPPMCMAAPALCAAMAPGGAAFGATTEGCAIGFKPGGAQDATNFRENVAAGHLPLPSDVTFEGLISDYFFDTSPSPSAEWVDVGSEGEAAGPRRPTELFAPTYSLALAPDPLLVTSATSGSPPPVQRQVNTQYTPQYNQQDVFLAVGLDSGIIDFRRPRLNLNILLDVSGSMDCSFNRHYYDAAACRQAELTDEDARHTKLDVAKEVIKGMLDRLGPEDSVSISLFSDRAVTPKRMGRWGAADATGVKAGIDALRTIGGTNFQAGLDEASAQLRHHPDCADSDPATTENRMIVLTDAEANCGDISETGLLARMKVNAADRLYTTIVGVGLDFQTALVEGIMRVRGANYFSVHSPGEFKRRLDEEFDFMVAPLVFDLELKVDPVSLVPPAKKAPPQQGAANDGDQGMAATPGADAPGAAGEAGVDAGTGVAGGWRVLHVYGSPDSEEQWLSGGGGIMRVNTLFPATKGEEGIKGGVVMLRMRPPPGTTPHSAPPLRLIARYCDRAGKQYDTLRVVQVPPEAASSAAAVEGAVAGAALVETSPAVPSFFQSSGVRKAVVLARLVDALQCWLVDEWTCIKRPLTPGTNGWDSSVATCLGAAAAPNPVLTPLEHRETHPALRLRPCCPLLPPDSQTLLKAGADSVCHPELPAWQRLPGPGRWERCSQPLRVGPEAKAALCQLLAYVEAEVAALGDGDMTQEMDLLKKLVAV